MRVLDWAQAVGRWRLARGAYDYAERADLSLPEQALRGRTPSGDGIDRRILESHLLLRGRNDQAPRRSRLREV